MAWASWVFVFDDTILPQYEPHAASFLLVSAALY
jgi:hypothetical protein